MRAWAALLTIVAACSFDQRGNTGDDTTVDAPDEVVDADGDAPPAIDARPIDAADGALACVPGCDISNTILTTCQVDAPFTEVCAQGCSVAPSPHCKQFSPSNGATLADLTGVTAPLDVIAGRLFVLDTTDGSIDNFDLANLGATPIAVRAAGDGVVAGIGFRRADQGAGLPGLALWSVNAVTVSAGATVMQHGTMRFVGARAAIVLSRGAINVRGVIDAGAGHSSTTSTTATDCRECGGPGGGVGGTRAALATGCAPGGPGEYDANRHETGGGGGGLGTLGASGGDSGLASGGNPAAITTCSGPTLSPLAGGGGGGRGGYDDVFPLNGGVSGGGAGGAVQLTSLVSVTVAGLADLYAGGLGGAGSSDNYGGGGGGAGGGFLLEAPLVVISEMAKVTANGGGGGSGRTTNVGDAGNRSTSRAAGGTGDGVDDNDGRGGRGGVGADTTSVTLVPTDGNGTIDGTGGGGGAGGRVRINTGPAMLAMLGASITISPTPTIGNRPIE